MIQLPDTSHVDTVWIRVQGPGVPNLWFMAAHHEFTFGFFPGMSLF